MRVATLSPTHLRWLAALAALAQLPHVGHLPTWIAVAGLSMVALRVPATRLPPRSFPSWLLAFVAVACAGGVWYHYGYLFGREPCIAFLYLLVAIKHLEARRARDATLLLVLSVFLLLASFLHGQTILLAMYMLGYVVVFGLAASALSYPGDEPSSWRKELRLVGVLLLQGVPLAAALFVLFPRPTSPLWAVPVDGGARTGLSERMAPGSISELSLSDEVAFRVEFEGAPPERRQLYWRAIVLERFDGLEWSVAPRLPLRATRPPTGAVSSYRVMLEPHQHRWLVGLDRPASPALSPGEPDGAEVPIGTLASDFTVTSAGRVTQPVHYDMRSVAAGAFAEPIGGSLRTNVSLPASGSPRARALAAALRTAVDSDREMVDAVIRWLATEGFSYTLQPPLMPGDPIDAFLFEARRGFCEHFAGAFVFLLRAAGVPARVVTGYQGGDWNRSYLIIRQSDAHAWAEAYYDGAWHRVDPTGVVAPSRISEGLGAAVPATDPVPGFARLDLSLLKRLQLRWDTVNYEWRRFVVGFNAERQRSLARALGIESPEAWQAMTLIGIFSLLWTACLIGLSRWNASRIDPVVRTWQRFCARAARGGLRREPAEGPLDFAARAAHHWPEQREAIVAAGEMYASLRYGAEAPTALRTKQFSRAVRSLRLRRERRRAPA